MQPQLLHTAAGTAFALLPPKTSPAPLLLLFAMSGPFTLKTEPYCIVGRRLQARGWGVVALDLPCHGADRRPGEPDGLEGWAARTAAGEDIVADFRARVNDAVAHLVATGTADAGRLAAAGTSRGGFMAFHAAAGHPDITAVAAFAPVTDLLALKEFAGQESNPLLLRRALVTEADILADRAAWITIGNADTRVDTDLAIGFAGALARAAQRRDLPPRITLHVLPVPGHSSLPAWHEDAANWLEEAV